MVWVRESDPPGPVTAMAAPASRGDVMTLMVCRELETRQLPTETLPLELAKVLVVAKVPTTLLVTWEAPFVMLVDWLTLRNPSLIVGLFLSEASKSDGKPLFESEQ